MVWKPSAQTNRLHLGHRLAPCTASPRSMLQPVFPEDLHPITSARSPCPLPSLDPLPRCRNAYLLILRTSGNPRSAGGVQSGTQLLQAPLPVRLPLRGVSVKDGRWGFGAAQRRHFKLRETEWKIIEGNAGCCCGQQGATERRD